MATVKLHDKQFRTYVAREELDAFISELASRINADYESVNEPVVLVCVLSGAMPFTCKLMQKLSFPVELAFMKVSSYEGTSTTGSVRMSLPPTLPLAGKRVILVEDIVDTGITYDYLFPYVQQMGVADLKICSMFMKPDKFSQREHAYSVDYVGKCIPNDFIVGFGLDYDELGRNLNEVYILDE